MAAREQITLRPQESRFGAAFTLPVNPESVTMTRSRGTTEIGIINFRQILRFGPREVETITFTCLLPEVYDSGYCNYENLRRPIDAFAQMSRTWIPNVDVCVLDLVVAGSLAMPVCMTQCVRSSRPAEPGDLYVDVTLRAWVPTLVALVGTDNDDPGADPAAVLGPATTLTDTFFTSVKSPTAGSRLPDTIPTIPGALTVYPPKGVKPTTFPPRSPGPVPPARGTLYVVVDGDSLYSIAKHFYGTGTAWQIIWLANADTIPGGNPNFLTVGERLFLPVNAA